MCKVLLLARQSAADCFYSSATVLVLLFLGVAVLAGEFVAQLGLAEQNAFRISLQAFFSRLVVVMVITVQGCVNFNEESRNGQMQMMLATEVSRGQYLLSRAIGAASYALVLSLMVGVSLFLWTPSGALALWVSGLFLELVVMAMFVLFLVVTFQSPLIAISMAAAFYGLSRVIEPLLIMASNPGAGVIGDGMTLLGVVLPNLGRFNQLDWLVYGVPDHVFLAGTGFQAGVFVALFLTAALIDIYRREL